MNSIHYLLLALVAVVALMLHFFNPRRRREDCHNEASTVGTHATGIVSLAAEALPASRYILVAKGTGDSQFIVNIATTRPLGVCLDEPSVIGNKAAVALLGCTPGTLKLRANAAVTVGQMLYTAAAGKVSPTYGATLFLVGRALTPAAADGDLVEVAHCFPMINAVNTL